MTYAAIPAVPGPAVDTATKLVRETAVAIWQAGVRTIGRYVRLPGNSAVADIDARELEILVSVGFQVVLFQHVRSPGSAGWRVRDFSGAADALAALQHAKAAGYPPKAVLYLDLEGANGTADEVTRFVNDWSATVCVAGQTAGLYVGYQAVLGPQELWLLPHFRTYARDVGPRQVANRGFSYRQLREDVVVAGVKVDEAEVDIDQLGDVPWVCAAAPEPAAA